MAIISYIMQCLAFILLRRNLPHIQRPFLSPVGVAGAIVAMAIAAITFVFLFFNLDYRFGIIGVLIWYLAGLAYFAVRGRYQLVRSPEEDFALAEAGQRASHARSNHGRG